jgi:hypothetical protein
MWLKLYLPLTKQQLLIIYSKIISESFSEILLLDSFYD